MDQVEKISVTITSSMAKDIRDKVESGAYASVSEVIRAAMRALQRTDEEHAERIAAIRTQLQRAHDSNAGTYSNEEVFNELRARLRAKAAGGFHEAPQSPLE